MKRLIIILLLAGAAYLGINYLPKAVSTIAHATDSDQIIAAAYKHHRNGINVSGEGEVIRILADDIEGLRHQRFILELASGQTLLITHNIDIAPRVDSLEVGDTIAFQGDYEWNDKGGVIHWTHHDPGGTHVAGWLKKEGRIFQ